MDKLNITLHNPSSQAYVTEIINFSTSLEHRIMIPSEIGEKMKLLLQDDGFQECLKHAVEYQLNDSALYYFNKINKIIDPSYTSNKQDVLQSHLQTTRVVEISFKLTTSHINYLMSVVNTLNNESGFIALTMSKLCCLWQY